MTDLHNTVRKLLASLNEAIKSLEKWNSTIVDQHGRSIIQKKDCKQPQNPVAPSSFPLPDTIASTNPEPKPYQNLWKNPDWWMVALTAVIAFFAFRAFLETQRQANAAQDQLAAITNQFNLDERAWICTSQFDANTQGGRIEIRFKNIGKTVALGVTIEAYVFPATNVDKIPDFDNGHQNKLQGPLFPNEEKSVSEITMYGSNDIFVFGTIRYEDVFRKKHWIQFCRYLADGKIIVWDTHNKSDDG